MNNIKQKNTNNLTSLWKIVGNTFQSLISENDINYCYVLNSGWPNRIWFEKEVTLDKLTLASEIAIHSKERLTICLWNDNETENSEFLEKLGFIKKSEQIGMSIKLHQKFDCLNRIRFERIINKNQTEIWSNLYPQNFGYIFSQETLIKTLQEISYFLIYLDDEVVGTVITHKTEDVIGIHGLGILPKYRKQGLAEEVMHNILNNALDEKIELATLQSSAMGKNIYLQIGFTKDFLLTNYWLAK